MTDLQHKEQVEIDFWANSPTEKPGALSVDNLLNKMTDAPVLLQRMRPFEEHFRAASTILELGAGQGWASCLVKRLHRRSRMRYFDGAACAEECVICDCDFRARECFGDAGFKIVEAET